LNDTPDLTFDGTILGLAPIEISDNRKITMKQSLLFDA
jgi:hypothetical protein